ncbi:MAG TPA: reverse transcriptase family protein [Prolixibacteraceae bacterium]|nr:reverse transcriptase family protein [Prolixibacteraceae bacterium]
MIHTRKYLAYVLNCEYSELEKICSDIDKYYYERKRLKGYKNGEPQYRILYPSTGRLKIIQSQIKNKILSTIVFPWYVQGGVKKKDNITNASLHLGKKYKFMTDVKKFFPSVTYRMVYNAFIQNGFSFDIAHMLTKLTTYKYELPQGTPTSSYIANLVFIPIDKKIIELCEQLNITYSRFVDDLSFSSPVDFKPETAKILDIIKNSGFHISHKKTFYKTKEAIITGVKVGQNRLDATNEFKAKMNSIPEEQSKSKAGHQNYYKRIRSTKKSLKKAFIHAES